MEATYQSVLQAALRLPNDERIELIDELTASVDPADQAAIDAAWMEEVRRRWAEFEAGKSKTYSWDQVKKAARERWKNRG